MNFLIITHVNHFKQNDKYFAYAPYVREMNIWTKHVDMVEIVAPVVKGKITQIDLAYNHSNIRFSSIPGIEFTSIRKSIASLLKIPQIFYTLFASCRRADHIHLRCPGNIGLLGSFVQIFFPKKTKTAKYAGNWDPKSKQPFSYKIQKYVLSNTTLTKNIQVLVYGYWKGLTKNIKPFFTATYHDKEIEGVIKRNYNEPYKYIFVGSLVEGKRPLLAIKIIKALNENGIKCNLNIYGEGILKQSLKDYCLENKLNSIVTINGNTSRDKLKSLYKNSHFLLLPSKSEGWPKAIAEAMFFGVIAISTNISCLSWMLDEGRRGILIDSDLKVAVNEINDSIKNDNLLAMSIASQQWSQKYTLEKFESEVVKLLKQE